MSTPRVAAWFRASCPICSAIWAWSISPKTGSEVRLATWLCRNLPDPSLTHTSKQAFVAAWLTDLLRRERFHAGARQSAEVPDPQSDRGAHPDLRRQAVGKAFQQACLVTMRPRVAVTDQYAFEFHAQAYAPSRDYDGRFGHFDFRKHFYGRIGDFDSKEEFECACWLDMSGAERAASSSGCATWCGARAVHSFCRRPMAASTQTSSASCPERQKSRDRFCG
jgi:hypothetical protein